MVMGMANLAMACGNIGREGVGVNPLRGQNNVQGSCDMGSFPHELPGYRHVSDAEVRDIFETLWGGPILAEPGLRIPNMFDAAIDGSFQGAVRPGRGHRPVRPQHPARGARRLEARWTCRRAGPVPQRDRALRARVPARGVVPREGRHLHQRRAPDQPGAPGDAAARSASTSGRSSARSRQAMGYPMLYDAPGQIMDEIAATTPTFAGVSFAKLDGSAAMQWPCNEGARGTPIDARGLVRARQGQFVPTVYVPTDRTQRTASSR